jgi:hypothetical protein
MSRHAGSAASIEATARGISETQKETRQPFGQRAIILLMSGR